MASTDGQPCSGETSSRDEERWLTRGVGGIGIASLLADVGHEIPTALLPSFLTSTLGAPAAALGLIEGVADASAGVARFAGGALADDPERRRAVAVGGYTATAVLSSLIGVCTATWQVGVLRAGAWTARGLRVPARNALLADVAPRAAYGRAYGFERMMDNLGAIGGPLLALGLITLVGVRTAILLSVIPGLLATLAIVYAIRSISRPNQRERSPIRLRVRPVLEAGLSRLFVGIGLFECGNMAATLLILRASDLLASDHSEHRAASLALVLYIGYNAAAALASVPAGHVGDKSGFTRVLAIGAAAFAIAFFGLAAGGSLLVLGLWFIAAGVGIACVESPARSRRHERSGRNTGIGVRAAGRRAEPRQLHRQRALAGVLWTVFSPEVALTYGGPVHGRGARRVRSACSPTGRPVDPAATQRGT